VPGQRGLHDRPCSPGHAGMTVDGTSWRLEETADASAADAVRLMPRPLKVPRRTDHDSTGAGIRRSELQHAAARTARRSVGVRPTVRAQILIGWSRLRRSHSPGSPPDPSGAPGPRCS
jgi:hypothetical protein